MAGLDFEGFTFGDVSRVLEEYYKMEGDGIIGLGPNTNSARWTKLSRFYDRFRERQVKFSLRPNKDKQLHRAGELIFGEPDEQLYKGQIRYVPTIDNGQWRFKLDQIHLHWSQTDRAQEQQIQRQLQKQPELVLLDSTTNFFVVREQLARQLNNFMSAIAELRDNIFEFQDCELAKKPNLVFTANGVNLTLTPQDYVIKYLDHPIRDNNSTRCISAFKGLDISGWIFGNNFMRKYLTVFDVSSGQVGFAKNI